MKQTQGTIELSNTDRIHRNVSAVYERTNCEDMLCLK